MSPDSTPSRARRGGASGALRLATVVAVTVFCGAASMLWLLGLWFRDEHATRAVFAAALVVNCWLLTATLFRSDRLRRVVVRVGAVGLALVLNVTSFVLLRNHDYEPLYDPMLRVHGRVRDARGEVPRSAELRCHVGALGPAPVSTSGEFDVSGIGCLTHECKLIFVFPDGGRRVVPVSGHCEVISRDCGGKPPPPCSATRVDMILPAGPDQAPGAASGGAIGSLSGSSQPATR